MKEREIRWWQWPLLWAGWLNLYFAELMFKAAGFYDFAVQHGYLPPINAKGERVKDAQSH